MEDIVKKIIKTKTLTVKLTEYSDDTTRIERTNDGFYVHEILGLIELVKQEILAGQMKNINKHTI